MGVDQSYERQNASGWFPVVFLSQYRPNKETVLFYWEEKHTFVWFWSCFSEDRAIDIYKNKLLA